MQNPEMERTTEGIRSGKATGEAGEERHTHRVSGRWGKAVAAVTHVWHTEAFKGVNRVCYISFLYYRTTGGNHKRRKFGNSAGETSRVIRWPLHRDQRDVVGQAVKEENYNIGW